MRAGTHGFNLSRFATSGHGWPGATGTTGIVPSGVTNTYGWGPNGHPIQLNENSTNTAGASEIASIHWDGDDILFGVDQSGYLDFEVGKLGSANRTGEQYAGSFTVTDRDMTGQAVSSHTWQDFGAWDSAPPGKQCAACSRGQASEGFVLPHSTPSDNDNYTSPASYLSGVREDGYNDGYGNTFQGVRAYDGNLGQWTSPDAYAGDVHDPMSQKPYMWNGNSPLVYADPSGYIVVASKDVISYMNKIAGESTTFKTMWNAINKDQKNTYTISFDRNTDSGQIAPGKDGQYNVTIGTAGSDNDKLAVAAHEVAHSFDQTKGTAGIDMSHVIPNSVPSPEGELNREEEAHAYVLMNAVVTEASGTKAAASAMETYGPGWGSGGSQWDIGAITKEYCHNYKGGGGFGC